MIFENSFKLHSNFERIFKYYSYGKSWIALAFIQSATHIFKVKWGPLCLLFFKYFAPQIGEYHSDILKYSATRRVNTNQERNINTRYCTGASFHSTEHSGSSIRKFPMPLRALSIQGTVRIQLQMTRKLSWKVSRTSKTCWIPKWEPFYRKSRKIWEENQMVPKFPVINFRKIRYIPQNSG